MSVVTKEERDVAFGEPVDSFLGPEEEDEMDGNEFEVSAPHPGRFRSGSVVTRILLNDLRKNPLRGTWVTGIMMMEDGLTRGKVEQVARERLLTIPRFRSVLKSRPVFLKSGFKEIDVSSINLDYHIREHDEVVVENELLEFLGKVNSPDVFRPDLKQPLWFLTLVRLNNGKSCLVSQISHSMADGQSQIGVLMRIMDPEEDLQRVKTPVGKKRAKKPAFGPLNRLLLTLKGTLSGTSTPFKPRDRPNSLMPPASYKPSLTKKVSFGDGISLSRMKAVKNRLPGATLNDVIMTVLTMALQEFYREQGDISVLNGKKKVNMQFPVSLREKKDGPFTKEGDTRNFWSYGFLEARMKSEEDLLKLFWSVKGDLDRVKRNPAPFVVYKSLLGLAQFMPRSLLVYLGVRTADLTTAQLSNVQGPEAATVSGVKVEALSFFISAPIHNYIGLISFGGEVAISMFVDQSLPDPALLTSKWLPAFERFEKAVFGVEGDIKASKSCLRAV